MGISAPLDTPIYQGGQTTVSSVPGLYPISLAGHTYFVDMHPEFHFQYFRRGSIDILRDSQDVANLPGENSLNPEDLWRRTQESWHHGAGQNAFDRSDSDPYRFRATKGIDPWTKYQMTLLPDTANRRSSANTGLYLVSVGTRLYLTDGASAGANLYYATDITVGSPTFTAVTGTPAVAASSITSDGFNVYMTYGASGLYSTTRTGAAASQLVTTALGSNAVVAFLKGRLMLANGNKLYNLLSITPSYALGTTSTDTNAPLMLTHADTDFVFNCFGEGQGNIYIGGFSGDKSLIYRTTIRPDGTALDVPAVAGELPDGEIVRSLQGYLGFMVVGTDRGVRLAQPDGQGNLTLGALISTPNSVQCFEPQDRFVWFGYTNYDGTSTGLGRLDLSTFTQPLTPAYASDLMSTAQGIVTSVATFQNQRVYAVSGSGFWTQTTTKVASGTIDSGVVTYGIHDAKVPMYVDVRHLPLVGSYQAFIATDGGAFSSLGTTTTANIVSSSLATSQPRCWTAEWRLVLNRANSSDTVGPTIQRSTLRSFPAATTGEEFIIPLVIHETVTVQGQEVHIDTRAEVNYISTLVQDRRFVTLQEGGNTFQVFVVDYEWRPHHATADNTYWNGICTVTLHSLAQ